MFPLSNTAFDVDLATVKKLETALAKLYLALFWIDDSQIGNTSRFLISTKIETAKWF